MTYRTDETWGHRTRKHREPLAYRILDALRHIAAAVVFACLTAMLIVNMIGAYQ